MFDIHILDIVTERFGLFLFKLELCKEWIVFQILQLTLWINQEPEPGQKGPIKFTGGLLSITKYHKGTTVDVLYLRSSLVWLFSNVKFLENISDRALNITVCVVGALAAVGLLFLVF